VLPKEGELIFTAMRVSVAALVLSVAALGIAGWQMARQPVRCLTLIEAKDEAYILNGAGRAAEWRVVRNEATGCWRIER
jgi:hypothetical protein